MTIIPYYVNPFAGLNSLIGGRFWGSSRPTPKATNQRKRRKVERQLGHKVRR